MYIYPKNSCRYDGDKLKTIVDNANMENKRDSFTDQIQSLLKDKSHKVVAFVPLESSNLNRCRHLVILRAPSDNTSKHAKHKRYGLTMQFRVAWIWVHFNV